MTAEAAAARPGNSRRRSIAKAISWRCAGSLDTLVLSFLVLTFLGPMFGMEQAGKLAHAQTAGFIAITEVFTKILLYYLHERAWAGIAWGMAHDRKGRPIEGRRRSAAKTAAWRALATLDTILLAWLFTGHAGAALSIGAFEVVTKLALYYVHERVWERLPWR